MEAAVAGAHGVAGRNRLTPFSSLRANGSRERAPDDGLREAIHVATREGRIASLVSYGGGKVVVNAPRNGGKGASAPLSHHRIDAPWPAAGEREVEENEAEERGKFAAVQHRIEALGAVRHEIGDRCKA